MPLHFGPFGNKFSPKKAVARKAVSLSTLQNLDRDTLNRELNTTDPLSKIGVNLGGNKIVFDGESWISETGSGGVSQKELNSVKKSNEKLKEENNLLKLKMEILLDMLAKSTAEHHLQSKEIEDLKAMVRSKSQQKSR